MSHVEDTFDTQGKRIGILIIAYDAESRILDTLGRVPESIWRAIEVVYVLDDCSRDETVSKALSFGRWQDKMVVLRNRVNQRHGGSQKIGYQAALDRGLDVIVLLDADGRYPPESLPDVLKPAVAGEADVVIGSRLLPSAPSSRENMPRLRYWGNTALSRAQNRLSGLKLAEFHSGFRAYTADFLRHVPFWENADEHHFDTQILLQARRQGARIAEVPIPARYAPELRSAHGFVYAANCLAVTLAYYLHEKNIVYSRSFDLAIRGRKYFEKFHDPMSSHSLVWGWMEGKGVRGKKVLELGVGDASLTQRLSEGGAMIDGVEIDVFSADLAKPYCRRVMVSDLNQIETLGLDADYDFIVAADVLEHLHNPEVVLSVLKRHLKVGGHLVVSLPNVGNLYVRLNMLFGRFPYHTKGILDRTHLHFYTLSSAERMLVKTGWVVEQKAQSAIPLAIVFPFLRRGIFKPALWMLHGCTRLMKGLLAYQGIFYCRNPNSAQAL